MPSYELGKSNSAKVLPHLEQGTCIVLHYMDGCVHCHMFMPMWKKLCSFYNSKGDYMLVSVEYGNSSMLPATMQNVQGFPTLRAYRDAKPVAEFNDNRSYDAVAKFIEQYGNNGAHGPAPATKKRRAPSRAGGSAGGASPPSAKKTKSKK